MKRILLTTVFCLMWISDLHAESVKGEPSSVSVVGETIIVYFKNPHSLVHGGAVNPTLNDCVVKITEAILEKKCVRIEIEKDEETGLDNFVSCRIRECGNKLQSKKPIIIKDQN